MKTSRTIRTVIAALAVALPFGLSHAQADYPTAPVKLLVGFAPGGPTDFVARLVAKHLHEDLKQPFIVENKAGAAGNIATLEAVKAQPDGQTGLIASVNITINPSMSEQFKFDGRTDIKPVAAVSVAPTILVVRNTFPASNYAEFLAEVRKNPNKYSSAAPGASPLLATELFTQLTRTTITAVPYKGAAPALVDLIAGHVDMSFATLGTVLPHIKAGKLKAIAIASPQREPQLPDVATFKEAGLANFSFDAWVGMFVPAKTPDAVVGKLSASLAKLTTSKGYASQLVDIGMTPVTGSTPTTFARTIAAETELYQKLGASLKSKSTPAK
jgi:tripartite-type tricarboxylate transporter receptor subunit TctC